MGHAVGKPDFDAFSSFLEKLSPKGMFIDFRERGREGGGERNKENIDVREKH